MTERRIEWPLYWRLKNASKKQVRLDCHRFKQNVGNVGNDGYQHPPVVEWNLPPIDAPPERGMKKHWPSWKQKPKV